MTTPGLALIAGASVGIGAEFARQLAALGHDLIIVARDAARLEQLAAELVAAHDVAVEVLVADLLDPAARDRVESRIAASGNPVDYLVVNAGFGLNGEFDENTVDDEARMLEILATVPLRLSHAALGQMQARRHGTILIVSSTAGLVPLGSYSAAKAWSISFARWANPYYLTRGVTVTALAPGFVRTEFHERMGVSRESMAPRALWLDAAPLVRTALRDAARGRAVSIPTLRYKVLMALARLGAPLLRFPVARRARQNAG